MRYKLVMLCMLSGSGAPAMAQVSVSIGINLSSYPHMQRVSGYPVYYATGVNSNLFFYDGMYWAYQGDNWYASSWYNGPWELVSPYFVPLYVLRVPVRYYRSPPLYFNSWNRNAAPRWNEHWGNQWAQRRSGWDRWNRNASPAPAPLPSYQRQYAGSRYPQAEQQQQLQVQNYRYQPRDAIVQQRAQEQQRAPAPALSRPGRTDAQDLRPNRDLATQPSTRMHDGAEDTRGPQGQRRDDYSQRSAPSRQAGPGNADQRWQQPAREQQVRPQPQPQAQQQPQAQPQQPAQQRSQEPPAPAQREPGARGQEHRADPAEHKRGQGRDKEREDDGERGQRRDRGNN